MDSFIKKFDKLKLYVTYHCNFTQWYNVTVKLEGDDILIRWFNEDGNSHGISFPKSDIDIHIKKYYDKIRYEKSKKRKKIL